MSEVSTPVYFQEFKDVQDMGSQKQLKWTGKRGDLTQKFGWTIPNKNIIQYLVNESKNSKLFEIGAGNGYLSYEIKNNGGRIIPIDIEPPEETWVNVYKMSYEDINPKNVSRIILPWPPANSDMGEKCISYLNPEVVYFIGKENSTVTGSKEFHNRLETDYNCYTVKELPSWTNQPTLFKKFVR